MTAGLLFALATALVLMYVFLPLTRRRSQPGAAATPLPWSTNGRFRALEEQRAAALEALRELEFEFQLGNLTEEDYRRLRDRYSRRAIALLQAAEVADRELDAEIEEAVQNLRNGRARAAARPGAFGGSTACPRCGTLARSTDRFCVACGAALIVAGRPQRDLSPPAPLPSHGRGVKTPPSLTGKGARGRGRVPRWAAVSGCLALLFAAGVAAIYFQASGRADQQQPIGQAAVNHVHGLLVGPQDRSTVYLSHHDGLQVSRDGGRTWAAAPGVQGDTMGMVSHPAAPGTLYLTGHDVLLKSSDGGRTWGTLAHDLPGTDIHALAGHPDQPQTLYAFVAGHGLYRSANGGASWTLLSDRVPLSTSGIAVLGGTPETIYLATQDQGVLASSDGGTSWANASGFVNGALPTRMAFAIVYDPKSGDRYESMGAGFVGALYLGTDRGLFKSIDGGQSWNALPLRSEVAALALDPADSRVLLAADSRGQVFRSADRGLTWRGE
ncbi:MAG: hypothetical protein HY689_02310 [Chloroflexi bacterium]|nr:hypothetical protein [Chloroflexota bacterium]